MSVEILEKKPFSVEFVAILHYPEELLYRLAWTVNLECNIKWSSMHLRLVTFLIAMLKCKTTIEGGKGLFWLTAQFEETQSIKGNAWWQG